MSRLYPRGRTRLAQEPPCPTKRSPPLPYGPSVPSLTGDYNGYRYRPV